MTNYDTLNNYFEQKKDFYTMFLNYDDDAIRYALLRSLDNDHLRNLFNEKSMDLKKAYNSSITINEIVEYIMSLKKDVLNERKNNEDALINIVENMDIVNCGIRNDKVDDIIKPFVRNKEFKNIEQMLDSLNDDLIPRITNYIYWSYFNQLTNDLIENSFYEHPSIIPTLRKIHDIDFFIKINNKIIPFDLKITHISDDFFNIYSKKLEETNSNDLYITVSDESEINKIKNLYKSVKRKFNLPNYGRLSKLEMLEILKSKNDSSLNKQLDLIFNERRKMVEELSANIKPLEWWNYKYQGERLFSNNNRFFVFLAHKNSFNDGKDLKKNISHIKNEITKKLDSLSTNDIHEIKYIYEKDQRFNGSYTIYCTSILVTKE